jgi:hypothetical protein
MEKLVDFFGRGRSACTSPTQQARRTYMAPKVLQVLVVEAVMATVAASIHGSLNEPETGIVEDAKAQDFFLTKGFQEDPWSEYQSESEYSE